MDGIPELELEFQTPCIITVLRIIFINNEFFFTKIEKNFN